MTEPLPIAYRIPDALRVLVAFMHQRLEAERGADGLGDPAEQPPGGVA
jgi:hypothetical protein